MPIAKAIKAPLENVRPIVKELNVKENNASLDFLWTNENKLINNTGSKLLAKNRGSAANKLILGKPKTDPVQFLHSIPKSSAVKELTVNWINANIEKTNPAIITILKS